jgi:hypothetical protein
MTKARSNAVANAAKGDLTVGNGTDLSGILAVGSNGDTLVADSSTSTGLRYTGNFAAGKNKILNSDTSIWQRGTSFTTNSSATVIYTADRWAARANFPGNSSVQVVTQDTANVPVGSKFSIKSVVGTAVPANSSRMDLFYTLENLDTLALAGKTVTVSLQAKGIGNIDRITAAASYSTSGGIAIDGTGILTSNLTVNTSTFTKISFSFSVPSAATLTDTGTMSIKFNALRSSGSMEQIGDGAYYSQIQLEVGSVATAFQTATGTIQGELAACQRYYWRTGGSAYTAVGQGNFENSTLGRMVINLPVGMRVAPTGLSWSGIATYDGASTIVPSAIAIDNATGMANPNNIRLALTVSGATAYRPFQVWSNNNTAGFLDLSAEL